MEFSAQGLPAGLKLDAGNGRISGIVCDLASTPTIHDVAIINAHLREGPPSLHERQPSLPVAADAVVATGMAKKPADRYPSCEAFVDDLRAALGVAAVYDVNSETSIVIRVVSMSAP